MWTKVSGLQGFNEPCGRQCFSRILLYYKQVNILISKNQALQILYLKHHDNVYKTP